LVIGYLISRQACRPAFSNSYFETLSLPALARCYLAALPSMSLIPFAPFYFLIYFVSHHFPATAHFRHHDFFDNDRFACRAVVGRRRVLKRSFESHDRVQSQFGIAGNRRRVFHLCDLAIVHASQRRAMRGEIPLRIPRPP